MSNLSVSIAGVTFKNPVMTASGTFGSGVEFSELFDLSCLGAVVVKGVSYKPWKGNNTPRVAEVYGGMLNAVGLQNPGVNYFIENSLPFLRKYDTRVIVNVCGHTVDEYVEVVKALQDAEGVDMLELNISCPNISEGGLAFGVDKSAAYEVTAAVKKHAKQPLIVKLSPNVTDITEIARAAEAAGADALSLINTLLGMRIDLQTKKPILANKMGGLSGPCIKPVAVRMVYQVAGAVKIPIIGMGGISTGADAMEFILAGATGVAVGTANFNNPYATIQVIDELKGLMKEHNISDINSIIGIAQ